MYLIIDKPEHYPAHITFGKYKFTVGKNGLVFFNDWPNKDTKILRPSKFIILKDNKIRIDLHYSVRKMLEERFNYIDIYLSSDEDSSSLSEDGDSEEEESDYDYYFSE